MNDEFSLPAHHVARLLKVPARTLRHKAATGQIPAKKKGVKLWFFLNDLSVYSNALTSASDCYLARGKK